MKVLILEPDQEIANSIIVSLEIRWPDIEIFSSSSGVNGLEILESKSPDLVIMDKNLSDIKGISLLKQIRAISDVPIIVLASRRVEKDIAHSLELGADDYIVKPFRPRNIVARVNAVLRRSIRGRTGLGSKLILRGGLTLDLSQKKAIFQNNTTNLTPTEAKMLFVLMKNPGQTTNRQMISQYVSKKKYFGDNDIRTYIRRIREKLKDQPPKIILTDRGEGYKFIPPSR